MTQLDIIIPVNESTDSVSSLVAVEKLNGNLRVYLEPRNLNKAITREHYRLPEKLKIGKLQGWTKFPRKYGRPDNSMTYCSDTATQYTIKIR